MIEEEFGENFREYLYLDLVSVCYPVSDGGAEEVIVTFGVGDYLTCVVELLVGEWFCREVGDQVFDPDELVFGRLVEQRTPPPFNTPSSSPKSHGTPRNAVSSLARSDTESRQYPKTLPISTNDPNIVMSSVPPPALSTV